MENMSVFHGLVSLVLLYFVSMLNRAEAGAKLELNMAEYDNPSDHEWDGSCCDLWCVNKCDHIFTFNFDNKNGDMSNAQTSTYYTITTGTYDNSDTNIFGASMQGVTNPIVVPFSTWPGSILFKSYIQDDDNPFSNNDHVDSIVHLLSLTPYRGVASASWTSLALRGMRPNDKTTLSLQYRLYCNPDYYGSDCATYCVATDNANGHYTCDPATGAIVCLSGYEDTSVMCRTFSNDCLGATCNNGATCVDGVRSYTCTCVAGYTGTHCETNINECASSPCQYGGSCQDLVNAFFCHCQALYTGPTCAVLACSVNICVHGGTCYGNNQCLCPVGYTGSMCEVDICTTMTCQNSGICSHGLCQCAPGYIGTLCDVRVCDVIRCQNNASCMNGTCVCPSGFQGISCEINTICSARPCQHDGTCYALQNSYLCSCLSGYAGQNCEAVMSSPSNASYASSQMSASGCSSSSSAFESSTSGRVLIALLVLIAVLLIILIVLACFTCRWRRRARHAEKELHIHTAGAAVSFITSSTAPSTVRGNNTYVAKGRLDSSTSQTELMNGIYASERSMSVSSDVSGCDSGFTNSIHKSIPEEELEPTQRGENHYAELEDVKAVIPPEVPAKRPMTMYPGSDGEINVNNTC